MKKHYAYILWHKYLDDEITVEELLRQTSTEQLSLFVEAQ